MRRTKEGKPEALVSRATLLASLAVVRMRKQSTAFSVTDTSTCSHATAVMHCEAPALAERVSRPCWPHWLLAECANSTLPLLSTCSPVSRWNASHVVVMCINWGHLLRHRHAAQMQHSV